MIKLNLKKEYDIVRGDSITIVEQLTNEFGMPIPIDSLTFRCHIKSYSQAKTNKYLFSIPDKDIIKEDIYFKITITSEMTWQFEATKKGKPYLLGVSIYSKELNFRRELQFGLNVYDNIVTQLR